MKIQRIVVKKMNKDIINALKELTEELYADIAKASNREEHVRVTARANKAAEILGKAQLIA